MRLFNAKIEILFYLKDKNETFLLFYSLIYMPENKYLN